MPERQLGEVPEAAVDSAWVAVKRASLTHPETRQVLEAAMDPILGDQRLVPASAVADAVRAEWERVDAWLQSDDARECIRYWIDKTCTGGTEEDWVAAERSVESLRRALSPADGNTKEEG